MATPADSRSSSAATPRAPVVLLDSATMYYRAFHAMPSSLRAPGGSPVGAVRGFVDKLAVLVRRLDPAQVVACWDEDWRPRWRTDLVPSYKAHRARADGAEDAPDGLAEQVEVIADLLGVLGIPRIGAAGCEADDVIATLAARTSSAGLPVDVVSGDRDLLQLVDDAADVRVVSITRGVKDAEIVDEAALARRHGVADGRGYLAMSVLRGDPSDGLPGVTGIGERTTVALLERFEDLAGVLAAAQDPRSLLSATQRSRLQASADALAAAEQVFTAVRDAAVAPLPAAPGVGHLLDGADAAALEQLSARWGLASPLSRLRSAAGHPRGEA